VQIDLSEELRPVELPPGKDSNKPQNYRPQNRTVPPIRIVWSRA
jgi:hypothetical protein